MKYFICADIHGNVRALDAVFVRYREEFPCEFVFLGDCVGYGSHPDACLDKILALPRARLIMGNHEWALLDRAERSELNTIAAEALNWSEELLDGRYDSVIEERFAFEIEEKDILFVHASPLDPKGWPYIFSIIDADEAFYGRDFRLCFLGHTHVPALFSFNEGALELEENIPFPLDPGDRYIINPGSVGQSRDYDPRGACCVFDTKEGTITVLRCEYDVEAEAEDIYRAGLPKYLGDRLLEGM